MKDELLNKYPLSIMKLKNLYIFEDNKLLSECDNGIFKNEMLFYLNSNEYYKDCKNIIQVISTTKGYLIQNSFKRECVILTTNIGEYLIFKDDDYQVVEKYDYNGILVYL